MQNEMNMKNKTHKYVSKTTRLNYSAQKFE